MKPWIKDGIIAIAVAGIIDIIILLIVFKTGSTCVGDICYSAFLSSKFVSPVATLLIWPVVVVKSGILRIVALTIYYFIAGNVLGWIWRNLIKKNQDLCKTVN